jgi:hypothetical protein
LCDRVDERYASPATGSLGRVAGARAVDQDAAHHLRRHAEELPTVLPRGVVLRHQSKVRLMDERGRLQRVSEAFPPEIRCRPAAKLLIDQRH